MGQLENIRDDSCIVYEASYDKAGRLVKERNRSRIKKVLCGSEVVESYTYCKYLTIS